MDRLEELNILIEAQQKIVDNVTSDAEVMKGLKEKEVKDYIQDLLKETAQGRKLIVVFNLDSYYPSGKIELADDNGDRIFGADIEFYVPKHYEDDKRKLEFNIGTCGSFDKTDADQIMKYLLFSKCLMNFEELETLMLNKIEEIKPYYEVMFNEDHTLSKLKREKEDIIKTRKEAEVLESVKPLAVYRNVGYCQYRRSYQQEWKGYEYCQIKSIKEKTIDLEVGYYTEERGFQSSQSCRVPKSVFVGRLGNNCYELVTN